MVQRNLIQYVGYNVLYKNEDSFGVQQIDLNLVIWKEMKNNNSDRLYLSRVQYVLGILYVIFGQFFK